MWQKMCERYIFHTTNTIYMLLIYKEQYTSGPLRQELNIKHEIRLQGYADEVDLEALITYLWCQDHHDYKHDRYRIQIAFYILLFFYTAARCGSFTRKDEYKDLEFTYKV